MMCIEGSKNTHYDCSNLKEKIKILKMAKFLLEVVKRQFLRMNSYHLPIPV